MAIVLVKSRVVWSVMIVLTTWQYCSVTTRSKTCSLSNVTIRYRLNCRDPRHVIEEISGGNGCTDDINKWRRREADSEEGIDKDANEIYAETMRSNLRGSDTCAIIWPDLLTKHVRRERGVMESSSRDCGRQTWLDLSVEILVGREHSLQSI